jgi:aminopeptidase N
LRFGRTLEVGTHVLAIEYQGKISERSEGLFISRYGTPDAPERMLATQFEPVSARRFVPCWDEPARKASFSISVEIAKGETAVSNMPVDQAAELADGRQRIRFQQSPKMSPYLLFLAIGDFERLERTVGDTIISVLARRGSAHKGQVALESAAQLLPFYNAYFGVPYPLPKLDLVAVPGAGGFAAMENWGAILSFENALLLDPDLSPESAKQRVFAVLAHEMAHQWFGNLVTMAWWDELWLNEGFASWMESKATDHFHPEWKVLLQAQAGLERAMQQDAKRTTHPVVQPVRSGEQANQAFDAITYLKGQAVVRMLEDYVGEDTFRQGVRAYMGRYAYQNTTTADFWAELERAAEKPVRQIAEDFTLRPGVPLITIESAQSDGTRTTLGLKQARFAVDESALQQQVWRTPVSVAALGSTASPVSRLIAGPTSFPALVEGPPPVKLNIGQTGYYRSQYSGELFRSVAERLNALPSADQLGLLHDTWALGEAGVGPLQDYFELVQKLSPEAEPVVWRQVIGMLVAADRLYAGLAGQARFRSFARTTLSPVFARVGWDATTGESDNVAVLREDLLSALGRFGNGDVVDEARRRFQAFMVDPKSLPAALRLPTLRIVALTADRTLYDALHDLARRASDPLEKDQLFLALAHAADPGLAARTLEIALSNEPAARTGPLMIKQVASDNPDLAWDFALSHMDDLGRRLDEGQRSSFMPSLAAQSTSATRLPDLRRFIDHRVAAEVRPQVDRFYADLEFRLMVRAERLPQVDQWLAVRAATGAEPSSRTMESR